MQKLFAALSDMCSQRPLGSRRKEACAALENAGKREFRPDVKGVVQEWLKKIEIKNRLSLSLLMASSVLLIGLDSSSPRAGGPSKTAGQPASRFFYTRYRSLTTGLLRQ